MTHIFYVKNDWRRFKKIPLCCDTFFSPHWIGRTERKVFLVPLWKESVIVLLLSFFFFKSWFALECFRKNVIGENREQLSDKSCMENQMGRILSSPSFFHLFLITLFLPFISYICFSLLVSLLLLPRWLMTSRCRATTDLKKGKNGTAAKLGW